MSADDDALTGRLMTRREVLALFGAAGAALVAGCDGDGAAPAQTRTTGAPAAAGNGTATAPATSAAGSTSVPACVVVPELTEGPFFIDETLNRSDIRSDPSDNSVVPGDRLDLTVNVSRVDGGSCSPLPGARVDVWQCDALGAYSGVSDPGFDTSAKKFLRGYQVTDAGGRASFTTIYPGWYPGRATHIHFKVRTDDGYEFTSQWFFDDALSDTVHAQGAYAAKGADGRVQNSDDAIFRESDGLLTLAVAPSGGGYAATFDIGLRLS